MAALIGLVLGALAGHFVSADWGTAIGGLAGFFFGAIWSGQRERAAYRKPDLPVQRTDSVEARLAALERRIADLEAAHAPAAAPAASSELVAKAAPLSPDATSVRAASPVEPTIPGEGPPRAIASSPEPSALPPAADARPRVDFAASEAAVAATNEGAGAAAPKASVTAPPAVGAAAGRPPIEPIALWRWFTGGNAITRIGVVVLFFGVAFLLRYFAEHFTIPIGVRLLGVAFAGAALIAAGARIARTRPAYGWSLEAAGAGVLYLTAFAAYQQFHLVPATVALALLAAISGLTVFLALTADAPALAALALAGAFLAPLLTDHDRDPIGLFGYFAAVNAVVLLICALRPWRAVSVLGFVFTFALGLWWGDSYYRPGYFTTVEPFLIAFFLAYLAIAMLHARRQGVAPREPLDGVIVFGVPLVAFALQAALVADTRYGAAISAVVMAVAYLGLALVLRRRAEPGWAALARYDLALAVVLASIAIPFAFDHRTTAALWAIEGALVFWLGIEQRVFAMRVLALLLQVAAGLLFLASGVAGDDDRLFLNAFFMGVVWVSAAGFATAYLADRYAARLSAQEVALAPLVFGWAALWWLLGGGAELVRLLPRSREGHAVLAWVAAAAFVALVGARFLPWRRLASLAVALPPVMLLVAMRDLDRAHTTLLLYGGLLWPAAWAVHFYALRAADAFASPLAATPTTVRDWRDSVHVATALALTAHIAWELSEWVGRISAEDTVWMACAAALPAIGYLGATPAMRADTRWPFTSHARAYALTAALPIAIALGAWVIGVNLLSPGEPFPLPYVPLLNPLDLTLALALGVLFAWTGQYPGVDDRRRFMLLGLGVFVSINGAILRIGHHVGDIPWDLPALLESRPLQAALTLAWTVTGVALMFVATRRAIRPLWMVGAALLALVVVKLFAVDLSALSGLPRVIAFLGVGSLLLLVGYLSPLPPAAGASRPSA